MTIRPVPTRPTPPSAARPSAGRVGVAVAGVALLGAALAACGGGRAGADEDDAAAADGVRVVATTSVLGDVVADVVGDAGTVSVLMDGGQDPHTFQLSARQAAELGEVDLVVANGLGLEAGIAEALDQAAADGVTVLEVGPALDPIPAGPDGAADHAEEDADHDDHDEADHAEVEQHTADDGHDHGALDPHVWLDVDRMSRVPALVAGALDDVADGPWDERAARVGASLSDLDREVADRLATVPSSCRRLASNHDSLHYLADRYNLDVAVTLVPGTSTEVEPSARDLARAVDVVTDLDVRVLVAEDTANTRVADVLARDVGGDLEVVVLPLSTIGGPSGVTDYDEMMRRVADGLATALPNC